MTEDETQPSPLTRLLNWANTPLHDGSYVLKKLHTVFRIFLITFKEFTSNELNIRASALTYTILLSLVPMLALSTAVLKGMGGNDQLRTAVYSYIDTLDQTTPLTTVGISTLPKTSAQADTGETDSATSDKSMTNQFRSVAEQIFNYVDRTNFAALGTIGVLGVLLSAILVLSNIEMSMNTIWHVSSGRSLIRKVTDYLTLLILLPISINLGFVANTVLKNDRILNKLMSYLPGALVQTALLLLVPLFFIILTFFVIYIFFPNTKVKTGPALIGATFSGTLWFITQNFYIGLQIGVSKYNAIYGSFATLPLFLVWMFLGWVFILLGAQIAFSCQKQDSYQLQKLNNSPMEMLSAAYDILAVTFQAYHEKNRLQKKHLPEHCPAYSAELIFSCLQKLNRAQIILLSKKDILLPGAPPEKLIYQEVISAILGASFPDTKGGKTAASLLHQTEAIFNRSFAENIDSCQT
jgi:membrane protein